MRGGPEVLLAITSNLVLQDVTLSSSRFAQHVRAAAAASAAAAAAPFKFGANRMMSARCDELPACRAERYCGRMHLFKAIMPFQCAVTTCIVSPVEQ
jgi:hypothetical protein